MNVIDTYDQLPVGSLQKTRLYLQSKSLLSIDRKLQRRRLINLPSHVSILAQELNSDYIEIDCAGWLFAKLANTQCIAIELFDQSAKFWDPVYFEYDYLTWRPSYLPNWPVLAYYSTYFKYCELDVFLKFCQLWIQHHPKVIVGLDPTKIKFNYLKYDLKNIIAQSITDCSLRVLVDNHNDLIFSLDQK